MDPLWWLIPAGLLAGFIDSSVGGGGVITLPALLATGMPPHAAIATNKVAGTGASSMATWHYARTGLLDPKLAWGLFPMAVLASVIGAVTVLRVPEEMLLGMVALVVLAMVIHVLARPRFGGDERPVPAWSMLALVAWVAAVSFYDGLLGPGTGTLLLFGIVMLGGMPFLKAAAHGRVYNFGSNVGALAFFATTGLIDWWLGLAMMASTMIGASVGSRVTIRHGSRWIRPLFVAMALALLVRVLWNA